MRRRHGAAQYPVWRLSYTPADDNEPFCLRLAQEIVASKIRNQRRLLLRNHIEPPARVIDPLKRLSRHVSDAGSLENHI